MDQGDRDPNLLRRPRARRPSIVDVANQAGVSRQTVTRAMNDMPGISDDTKRRVLEAARALKYRPSRFGRGLVNRGTPSLGLVVVDITNPYFSELASSVLEAATNRGWTVLVTEVAHGGEASLQALAHQVDGVIGHLDVSDDRLEALFGDLPVLTLGREARPEARASIEVDYAPGLTAAIDHLIATGHSEIAMIDCSRTGLPSDRGATFERIIADLRVAGRLIKTKVEAEPGVETGRLAVAEAAEPWETGDAMICFNDTVAMGALKELQLRGLRVPQDVSVIGIDGLQIGRLVSPELTTLELDLRAVGAAAVDLVIGMASGALPLRGVSVHRHVFHRFVRRESA